MGGIFISYRRDDTEPYAGRLRDTLSNHFGTTQVFRDIDRINPGERFPQVIERAVGSCDALVALIGPKWMTVKDENRRRRIDDPKDYLRQEIEAALKRPDVLVVPVLIGSTTMPAPGDLPETLVGLTECHALHLTGENWDDQVARLIKALETVVEAPQHDDRRPEPVPPRRDQRDRPQEREPEPEPDRPWQPAWQASSQPAAWQPRSEPGAWRPSPATSPAAAPASSRSGVSLGIAGGVVVLVLVAILGFVLVDAISGKQPSTGPGSTPSSRPTPDDAGPGDPTVVLSPTSGPVGTAVTVTGTGYGKSQTIQIMFHAQEVATTLSAEDGTFTTRIKIPSTPFKGPTDITAIAKRVGFDSAPFNVT